MAKLDPKDLFIKGQGDPLELIAQMIVGTSFRVPTQGRGGLTAMTSSDVSAAIGYMSDPLERDAAVAVATRADGAQLMAVADRAYSTVEITVRRIRPVPLDLSKPADRFRLRLVVLDATSELIWPERRVPYGQLARARKMRKQTYIVVHRCATAVLQEAVANARREFSHLLFSHGSEHDRRCGPDVQP